MSTFSVHTLNDGNKVPGVAFGIGTAHFGNDDDNLVETLKTAISAGFRHLDGAEAYRNEGSLGKAIAQSGVPREELFVTTKAGTGLADIPSSFDESLKKLGLSYVDLYLIHWPYDFCKASYPSIQEAWKQMEAIKDSGRAKSIGVSNFRVRDLEKIYSLPDLKHPPAVNQIEFHPFMYEAGEELYQYMKNKQIALEAYGPTSPLTKLLNPGFEEALNNVTKSVASRARKDKVEPGQVLLRLAAQRGAIVVTTSGKDWRMREQLAAGALPELTQDEVDSLVKAAKPAPQRVFMKHMDGDDEY
ncbi:indole-3-acetaldehyde reductase [Rhodotorula toruloides]|uniref:Indole-3-acetaldehyde reductase n=1 Tax=Rhodotorula toruloides TaxID=5286 RepID=A0A511KH44_RHOTO|nr:indole-3-acetaldehyde reductase [Rhodotorula toruloides]